MTKDEFLSMISTELENMQKEMYSAEQRINYFRMVKPEGEEIHEATYQLRLVQNKVNTLRDFVTLPAYARIQAMSDVEIEEHKKVQVDELELNIKEIESREQKEKTRLSQLKARQEQLIEQSTSSIGRENIITEGKKISEEISRCDVSIASLERDKEEIRMQQEKIKAKSLQEIKQDLLSKIENKQVLASGIDSIKYVNDFSELVASVASDPKKRQQMTKLLSDYRYLSNTTNDVYRKIEVDPGLPDALIKILPKGDINNEIYVSDELMKKVQEFEDSYQKAKAIFYEQITEQKLLKLVGKEYGINSSEVDMEFLQQHTDKISDGKLEHLQSLVMQRNKLLKKIFKTKDTKREIDNLNNRIVEEQSNIYIEIIRWYKLQSDDLLGDDNGRGIQFDTLKNFQNSLKYFEYDISHFEKAINRFKENIQRKIASFKEKQQVKKNQSEEIAKEIRALGGEKYKETDIRGGVVDKNLINGEIADLERFVYEKNFIDSVRKEAQNQADIEEARLKGITVEKLKEMRQQLMAGESMVENTEEEMSHGMKR